MFIYFIINERHVVFQYNVGQVPLYKDSFVGDSFFSANNFKTKAEVLQTLCGVHKLLCLV